MNTLAKLVDKFFNKLRSDEISPSQCANNDIPCLLKAVNRFLKYGDKSDAFTVYFCFSEIFNLFGNGYSNTQKLLELLADHEYHSGELLSKHRDHYSHSVYVFALGLAIYANDDAFRSAFMEFYGYKEDVQSYDDFLYLWGMTALFHDIGYPFQLAHEQIKSYTEELWGKGSPSNLFVSFGNYDEFIKIPSEDNVRINLSLGESKQFSTLNQLFAYGLMTRFGYNESDIAARLRTRILNQPAYLDHGYFSAVILTKQLLSNPDICFNHKRLDVLTAIVLHNSFSRYDLKNEHPISPNEHPLAYLLVLCDEIQNWDRQAYGKASKYDPVPWDIKISISNNYIDIIYIFDDKTTTNRETGEDKINEHYRAIQNGSFVRSLLGGNNIKGLLKSELKLIANVAVASKEKRNKLYASENNFINLCDFARAIHASYQKLCKDTGAEAPVDFDQLSLEFKVSNIEQAKSYAQKLELINCFYSSKDLDYPVIKDFRSPDYGAIGSDNLGFLCREEHVRWVKEKLEMGWRYGTEYASSEERNIKKIHKDIVPYEMLSRSERAKDELMVNNIIPFLKKFGHNIRIYNYRIGRKPDLEIAGIGHRFFTDDTDRLKEQIKIRLAEYCKYGRIVVRTCFAHGADQLIAECANEMGIATKAVLPADYEDYIAMVRKDCLGHGYNYTYEDELRLRHLLAQTVVCKVVKSIDGGYKSAIEYLMEKCSKVIALIDDEYLAQRNNAKFLGAGSCLTIAKSRGLREGDDIKIITCHKI